MILDNNNDNDNDNNHPLFRGNIYIIIKNKNFKYINY